VSEVVPREKLRESAQWAADVIASAPPAAVQGTVRSIWLACDVARAQALAVAPAYIQLGNLPKDEQESSARARKREWRER
jgi:enoyl-CoA hydratase/carnithine racemase